MSRQASTHLAALAALALLAFAAERDGALAAGEAAPVELGKNLADETCQAQRRDGATARGRDEQSLDIGCGASSAVGALLMAPLPPSLPADGAGRHAAIEQALANTAAGADIAARFQCAPGVWLEAEGGVDALFRACTLTEGSWPELVVVAAVEHTLYVGEGPPALLAVLERSLAEAAGKPVRFAEAALDIKQLARALKRPLPVYPSTGPSQYRELMRLSRLYNSEQNFAQAEQVERRALEIETRLFGDASPGVGEALMGLALDVSNQGRFDEADALFRRAEAIVDRSGGTAERGRLASYRALDAANRGRFVDALRLAKEATALRRSAVTAGLDQATDLTATTQRSIESGDVAHSLLIEAAAALRVGDLPSAEAAATDALRIIAETPDLPLWWRPEALTLMGDINMQEDRVAAAQRNYRDPLAFRQRLFGDTAPTAFAYMKLGRLYERQELYPAAVAAYRSALTIVAHDRSARAELTADRLTPFITAATALAERDAGQRARLEEDIFAGSQMLGSGVAAQTIAKASARLAAGDAAVTGLLRDAEAAERKRDGLRVELASEQAKPDSERNGARETRLAADLAAAGAAADTLLRQVREQFPAYGQLVEPGAVKLAELRSALRGSEALLFFVIGRERSYALLVQGDRLVKRKLEIDEDHLAADVAELRRAFVPRLGTLAPYDLGAAFALYRKLLAPLAGELAGVDHLVVVAAGALDSLPLQLLVEEKPAPGADHDYRRAAWLTRRLAISTVPSVRAFVTLRNAPRAATATSAFLGFGDPAFKGEHGAKASPLDRLATQCREEGPVPAAMLHALAPLPETALEVRTIARLVGADPDAVVLGEGATEAAFRAHHPERYRVLYFATHGLLPGELRCETEPALVLSPPARSAASRAEDGLLEASEIAALRLGAELVVLSACNTAAATGTRFGGEALTGLAEACFYAGARTLVASHWQVPSAPTVRLMTEVFRRLGPDLAQGAAPALREAQLALIADPATAHPFYWAAFTVIGDGGPRTRSLAEHAER
jgi:CHAT domain-containing protein